MPATRTSIHRLVVGLALTVSLGGCAANVKDVTSSIVQTILPIPDGSFKHVAWLSDDLVVFVYSSKRDAKPSDFALGFYDLDTQEFRIETPPTTSKCFSIMLGWLAKLPDGRLGVVSSCNFFGSQTTYEANTLYARSLDSSDYTPLQQYPNDFHAKDYTFSPDMKRWIQSTLGYEFYEYQADGSFSRILQEYVRVTSPAWSESGDTIAFAGIRNDSDLGQVLVDETSLWTLYLMDSSDGDSRPLLGGVRFVWYLKWSPGHDCLSFRGEYLAT